MRHSAFPAAVLALAAAACADESPAPTAPDPAPAGTYALSVAVSPAAAADGTFAATTSLTVGLHDASGHGEGVERASAVLLDRAGARVAEAASEREIPFRNGVAEVSLVLESEPGSNSGTRLDLDLCVREAGGATRPIHMSVGPEGARERTSFPSGC